MNKGVIGAIILMIGLIGFQSKAFAGGKGGFGIKGGLGISTIGLEDEDFVTAKNRFRLGGTGGFGYEIATPKTFAFEIEALYSLKGQKQKFDNLLLGEGTVKDFLHYLNIPISFKFYFGDVVNIHFGGFTGVALGGTRKVEGTGILGQSFSQESNLFSDDQKDAQGDDFMKRIDGGIHFGLEFVGEKGVGIGSRASIGLADITNDEHEFGDKAARTAEVSVYAIFRLGRD